MTSQQLSSGDLLADRRADYARLLAQGGEYAEAAELMEQALEHAPGWAAGWFRLAEYAEKSGGKEAAVAALEKVVPLDPGDIFGARLRLAVLGAADMPAAPSSRYVERLFNDYAARFDTALVERLGYSVPQTLAALVARHAGDASRFAHAVDLGCGTGLFGERIRHCVDFLEGFDLSPSMLAKVSGKGIYDHLARADLSLPAASSGVFADGAAEGRADFASATDVLIYLGDLAEVFLTAARLVAPTGLFAFSVEDAGSGADYLLRPSLRYAHSEAFILARTHDAGFDMVAVERAVIRKEAAVPVDGLLFLARRRG